MSVRRLSEVCIDYVEVAEYGVFRPDSHYSSFVDVVDALLGNFVEVFEKIGVNECEYVRGLFRVVGPEWEKVFRRVPCGHAGVRGVGFLDA